MSGRTRSDRFLLLEQAVEGHASGALGTYIFHGPNGDRIAIRDQPNDPSVIAWRDDAVKKLPDGIEAGYTDALLLSVTSFRH